MALKLKDMSLVKGAQKLTGLGEGLKALIANIIAESNDSNIKSAGGTGNKQAYFNHSYDKDPSTNGGKLGVGVTVEIYYQPANKKEYDAYEVIDKEVGMLSGRRRLAVRGENSLYSFYTTNHPQEKPGLRTNVYGTFTAIDPAK